jgi:nucleoside 2-deoxyribosyltransferase
MPITTPAHLVPKYGNDPDHFMHVLECLIRPALEVAEFEVVEPSTQQGQFIHAEVIKNLKQCDLVLCDVSTLNPNVFMEIGIRTGLKRPIGLIRDELTDRVSVEKIAEVIGSHVYSSNLAQWVLRDEIPKLSRFVKSVHVKSVNKHALWRHRLGL